MTITDIDHIKAMFSTDARWFCEVETISNALERHRGSLLAVDGHFGSGKSFLAGQMALHLGMRHVDVDLFCGEGSETYLEHIDYDRLSHEIGSGQGVVLSGIMILAVIDKLNKIRTLALDTRAKIYVVKIGTPVTIWRDDAYHDEDPDTDWSPLENEAWAYNCRYRPRANSDHVFYRFCD